MAEKKIPDWVVPAAGAGIAIGVVGAIAAYMLSQPKAMAEETYTPDDKAPPLKYKPGVPVIEPYVPPSESYTSPSEPIIEDIPYTPPTLPPTPPPTPPSTTPASWVKSETMYKFFIIKMETEPSGKTYTKVIDPSGQYGQTFTTNTKEGALAQAYAMIDKEMEGTPSVTFYREHKIVSTYYPKRDARLGGKYGIAIYKPDGTLFREPSGGDTDLTDLAKKLIDQTLGPETYTEYYRNFAINIDYNASNAPTPYNLRIYDNWGKEVTHAIGVQNRDEMLAQAKAKVDNIIDTRERKALAEEEAIRKIQTTPTGDRWRPAIDVQDNSGNWVRRWQGNYLFATSNDALASIKAIPIAALPVKRGENYRYVTEENPKYVGTPTAEEYLNLANKASAIIIANGYAMYRGYKIVFHDPKYKGQNYYDYVQLYDPNGKMLYNVGPRNASAAGISSLVLTYLKTVDKALGGTSTTVGRTRYVGMRVSGNLRIGQPGMPGVVPRVVVPRVATPRALSLEELLQSVRKNADQAR